MRTNRKPWVAGLVALSAGVLLAVPAHAIRYCTEFNDAFLTLILTDQDSCASYPCNFYSHDFGDAREECGDELFRMKGHGSLEVSCDFCFWSECLSIQQNELGIVPLDEVGTLEATPAFRMRVLTAPSAFTIFRGGVTGDNPPMTNGVAMTTNRDYLFYLIQGHTRAEAIADPAIPVFFSIAGANADGLDHLVSLKSRQNDGAVALAWEDLSNGGDFDFNDVVFTTSCNMKIRPSQLPHPPVSSPGPTSN